MKKTGLVALCALLVGSCERLQPERVCAQEETLEAVRQLVVKSFIGNGEGLDVDLIQSTFGEFIVVELIRFERRDKASGAIHCRAQLRNTQSGSVAEITYSKQRQVNSSEPVYSVAAEGGWQQTQVLQVELAGLVIQQLRRRDGLVRAAEQEISDRYGPSDLPAALPPGPDSALSGVEPIRSPAPPTVTPSGAPPPANVVPPQKHDRVEYIGPPPIIQGPPPPPARPTTITNPSWARRPMPEFPERALIRGVQAGSATVSCQLEPSGSLTDCTVVSEDPVGVGFGAAALRAARQSSVTADTVERAAVGARVTYTSRFRAAD